MHIPAESGCPKSWQGHPKSYETPHLTQIQSQAVSERLLCQLRHCFTNSVNIRPIGNMEIWAKSTCGEKQGKHGAAHSLWRLNQGKRLEKFKKMKSKNINLENEFHRSRVSAVHGLSVVGSLFASWLQFWFPFLESGRGAQLEAKQLTPPSIHLHPHEGEEWFILIVVIFAAMSVNLWDESRLNHQSATAASPGFVSCLCCSVGFHRVRLTLDTSCNTLIIVLCIVGDRSSASLDIFFHMSMTWICCRCSFCLHAAFSI